MTKQKISLNDRFDLDKSPVLLNGTQALVRMMLMQSARDRAAGLNTAGYVTGYRGSPLGAVDMQMARAEKVLAEHDVTFQAGLNEDLAATALWGVQQAELRGEGTIMGERQKGRSDLKLASLRRDRYWVEKAREDAFALLDADPGLTEHPALLAEIDKLLADDETDFLLKS